MNGSETRHQLFNIARRQAGWTIQQLWIGYLALGGTEDVFHIEAYLHGLTPLAAAQQDVLAIAVNERLQDLYLAAQVPYLLTVDLDHTQLESSLSARDEPPPPEGDLQS